MNNKVIHVLSIEDNPGDAVLIEELLTEAMRLSWDLPRFEVEHVGTTRASLRRLKDGNIDVVLSDLDLPDSRAGKTVATLREQIPHMPIVVLTGREDAELARTSVRAGVQDYLFKNEITGSLLARTLIYAIERQENALALQKARAELEQRVAARTQELQQANTELKAEIAERKRVEKALRESEEQYRSLFERVPVGLYRTTPDGQYLDANQALVDMLNCPDKETLMNKNATDFYIDHRDRQRWMALMNRKKIVRGLEGKWRRCDGKAIWMRENARVIEDDEGQVLYYEGSLEDITNRKQIEARLRTRLRYERNLALLSRALLDDDASYDESITRALDHLQQAANAARVYIFQNFVDERDDLCIRQTHESCAPGVEPQIDNPVLQHISYAEGFQRWADILSRGKMIRGDVSTLPTEERAILAAQHIRSILVLPIRTKRGWQGFIGFDETRFNREWQDEDVRLLQTAAEMIGRFWDRQQAEEALRDNKAELAATVESSPFVMMTVDNEWRVQKINQRGLEFTGRSRNKMIGYRCGEALCCVHTFDHPKGCGFGPVCQSCQIKQIALDTIENGASHYAIETDMVLTPQQEETDEKKTLLIYSNPLVISSERKALIVLQDVTDRKQAKEALQERMKELTCLYAVSRDIQQDLPIDELCRRTVEHLMTAMQFPEITAAMIELNGRQFTSENYTQELSHCLQAKIIVGRKACGQLGVYYTEKKPFLIPEEQNLVNGIAEALGMEIKRKRAEEELQWRSRAESAIADLSTALLKSAPIDDISYRVLEHAQQLTDSAFGYVGYIDQETGYLICPTMTRDIWDECLVPDKDFVFEEFSGLWGWVLENQESILVNNLESDPRSSGVPAGHLPIRRFLSTPALIGDELVGQIALANPESDYTKRELALIERMASLYALALQRQRAEEEIEHYAAELERSNQDLEQFGSFISHDLREPARVVKSYLKLLKRDYQGELDEKANIFIDFALDGAKRMQEMISALLELSRVDTQGQKLAPTNAERVLERTLKSLNRVIEKTQAEVTHDPLPTVMADQAQLAQIFQNLIANGIKFRREDIPPKVHISSERRDDEWIFSVEDNGIGIDPNQADCIFQVFQRLHTREEYEGTGVGLALCKRIVERHGGRIWVESEPGTGSTFFFTLPGRPRDKGGEQSLTN